MFWSIIISIGLFIALLVGLNIGLVLGRRARGAQDDGGSTAAADGVVFAVIGLLIAFTFTASASRFDERRRLIVQQANALGTAHLRLDLLDPADRAAIRARMKEWVDLALRMSEFVADPARLKAAVADADRIQNDVWRLTVAAVERKQQPGLAVIVLPPQNEWIDLAAMRLAMNNLGMPPMVLPTVIVLSLVGSVLAGFSMSRHGGRRMLHMVAFAFVITLSIYVIMDLNQPRAGLIRIDAIDQTMADLRRSMDGAAPAP